MQHEAGVAGAVGHLGWVGWGTGSSKGQACSAGWVLEVVSTCSSKAASSVRLHSPDSFCFFA